MPLVVELIIFRPKTSMGIYNGMVIIGIRIPDRLSDNVKVTPKIAIKLNAGVPSKSPKVSDSDSRNEKSKTKANRGEITIIGHDTEIQ